MSSFSEDFTSGFEGSCTLGLFKEEYKVLLRRESLKRGLEEYFLRGYEWSEME
jgi:hypothetical protein